MLHPVLRISELASVLSSCVLSIRHGLCVCLQLLRRIGISAAGPEVPLLRRLAVEKGRSFLAHFSPRVGDPFHDVREWDYFR
jgi:hypothetical protein